ncbi:hypothetical protein BU26DRAFT_525612 [Trematosphaeria pertusa]|uniref:Uncharacterized protein n=1 Tax=Trematosphaeria pertusa TaxID=390896 RepID=A0A6A6HT66_9PLEO|nr:uncharacterized protein BU26DRAFT_525612 [Trematosphaeria pertusa]KAF2241089.1 hypothetical protein BU26DRAFT_525612 [Trematosphaeria pertusa]
MKQYSSTLRNVKSAFLVDAQIRSKVAAMKLNFKNKKHHIACPGSREKARKLMKISMPHFASPNPLHPRSEKKEKGQHDLRIPQLSRQSASSSEINLANRHVGRAEARKFVIRASATSTIKSPQDPHFSCFSSHQVRRKTFRPVFACHHTIIRPCILYDKKRDG